MTEQRFSERLQAIGRISSPSPPQSRATSFVSFGDTKFLLQQFRSYLDDPSATFRGHQLDVLKVALKREKNLIYIAPTGSGKSLLYNFVSYVEKRKCTIVISPLIALKVDMFRTSSLAGLDVCIWEPTFNAPLPDVLIVQFEHALHDSFIHFAMNRASDGVISRVVFDEAHVYVTDDSYREAMRRIGVLRGIPAPFVLLTATLTIDRESLLQNLFNISPEATHVHRERTMRNDLHFAVRQYTRSGNTVVFLKALYSRATSLRQGEKIMCFCKTRREVEDLENEMKIELTNESESSVSLYAFHANTIRRESVQQAWAEDERKAILFCTHCASCGINVATVRDVIFWGVPDSIEHYLQAAGRAGRDGNGGTVTMFADQSDMIDDIELKRWTMRSECRRTYLSVQIDATSSNCGEIPTGTPCDVCLPTFLRPLKHPTFPEITSSETQAGMFFEYDLSLSSIYIFIHSQKTKLFFFFCD